MKCMFSLKFWLLSKYFLVVFLYYSFAIMIALFAWVNFNIFDLKKDQLATMQ